MSNINYKELARAEALAAAQRDEMIDVLQLRYAKACEEQNEEDAAMYARKIRNKLLDATDKDLCADRPTEHKNLYKPYRQALRDLPEQKGFPFEIEWPEAPTE